MKKLKIGATVLCAAIGWYFGSLLGAVMAAGAFVMLLGLVEGLLQILDYEVILEKERREKEDKR